MTGSLVLSRRFNVLVGAATVHHDRFLLLKRSNGERFLPGVWGIPAGRVVHGESVEDAVVRELREETQLDGKVDELIGYSEFRSERRFRGLHNVQLNFLVSVQNDEVRLCSASHSEFCWIHLDDLDSHLLDAFTRSILEATRSHSRRT